MAGVRVRGLKRCQARRHPVSHGIELRAATTPRERAHAREFRFQADALDLFPCRIAIGQRADPVSGDQRVVRSVRLAQAPVLQCDRAETTTSAYAR